MFGSFDFFRRTRHIPILPYFMNEVPYVIFNAHCPFISKKYACLSGLNNKEDPQLDATITAY
jgi:hypothetical protein